MTRPHVEPNASAPGRVVEQPDQEAAADTRSFATIGGPRHGRPPRKGQPVAGPPIEIDRRLSLDAELWFG